MIKTKEKVQNPKNHVKPHDWFFKQCMAYPQVAKALVTTYLLKDDIKGMNLKTLKPEKTDFIDQKLGENACDLLFSVQKNNHKSYQTLP